ncbi:MAG: nucleotidyltransferase family protein [Lautropia sp.]|nr:nucleotidyltransferase family protein [Lautropia sp.]
MKAMLLAAGRGERMRPLTDAHPKPLLKAGGKPLIVWHLEKLAAAGFTDVVINNAWLGEQIPATLGDGSAFGLRLHHSAEGEALETAGGIARALGLLTEGEPDNAPFVVISSDVWSDADYTQFAQVGERLQAGEGDCWCLMVDNPPHHPEGDFGVAGGRLWLKPDAPTAPTLTPASPEGAAGTESPANAPDSGQTPDPASGMALAASAGDGAPADMQMLTYSGIGVYTPAMFCHITAGTRSPLRPWLGLAIESERALAAHHPGQWFDIGTPARLAELDARLMAR